MNYKGPSNNSDNMPRSLIGLKYRAVHLSQSEKQAVFSTNQPKPILAWVTRVFPPLALIACFPALGTRNMFSLAWRRWHQVRRWRRCLEFWLVRWVNCICCDWPHVMKFLSWSHKKAYQLPIESKTKTNAHFLALGTKRSFSRAWQEWWLWFLLR